jgi:hypothetical protein
LAVPKVHSTKAVGRRRPKSQPALKGTRYLGHNVVGVLKLGRRQGEIPRVRLQPSAGRLALDALRWGWGRGRLRGRLRGRRVH